VLKLSAVNRIVVRGPCAFHLINEHYRVFPLAFSSAELVSVVMQAVLAALKFLSLELPEKLDEEEGELN